MHVPEHYPAFANRTLLILANNALAKFYCGEERAVEPFDVVTVPECDEDNMRSELYQALSLRAYAAVQNGFVDVLLCVPEANKAQLLGVLHPEVKDRLVDVVPKNLAAMDLTQVMRILFEV